MLQDNCKWNELWKRGDGDGKKYRHMYRKGENGNDDVENSS